MSDVPKVFAEVKEKRIQSECMDMARADASSRLFRSPWRRIYFGVALGFIVVLGIYDAVEGRGDASIHALAWVELMILLLVSSMAAHHKKRATALLLLIQKESPALYAKIARDKEA